MPSLNPNDELSGGGGGKGARPKVLVSGCFDLLHNGHIEFFKEAASHGDLYVRIGRAANIKKLKNHNTMYSDEERLYMVQSVKWVHDAAVSAGWGMFDYLEDAKAIKPDIYFVNEDASQLTERMDKFASIGLSPKIVVASRKPNEGLTARSSTDMKARLVEMVKEEEAGRQALPMSAFHKTIPWRLCFCGGWMDLKWANEFYSGCIVTINIKFHPGICKDECGLATSSRKVIAKLWNGETPKHLESEQMAKYVWGAENFVFSGTEERHYIAGSQDHCGLFFAGVNKLCYAGGRNWPHQICSLNDPTDPKQAAIFQWLERVVHIVEIPFVSRPKGFSSQEINVLKDPSVSRATKTALVKALAEASEANWEAILAMDTDKLGKALSDMMKAWESFVPFTTNPYRAGGKCSDPAKAKQLTEWLAKYDRPHTAGCAFSGGGGGFLMVVSEKPIEGAMKITINNTPPCKPYKSHTLAEAHAAPKCGPPPAKPPWGVVNPWNRDKDGKAYPNVTPPGVKLAAVAAVAAALAVGVMVGKKM